MPIHGIDIVILDMEMLLSLTTILLACWRLTGVGEGQVWTPLLSRTIVVSL